MRRHYIKKVLIDCRECPSEEQLKKLLDWNTSESDIRELLDFIKALWWTPEWGYNLTECEDGLILELSVGGWLGNEMLMDALKENDFFWSHLLLAYETKDRYIFKFEDTEKR